MKGALKPREVAEWLGMDVSTVYRLQREGVIPFVTVGRSRRTAISALERLVDPSARPSEVGPAPTTGAG